MRCWGEKCTYPGCVRLASKAFIHHRTGEPWAYLCTFHRLEHEAHCSDIILARCHDAHKFRDCPDRPIKYKNRRRRYRMEKNGVFTKTVIPCFYIRKPRTKKKEE